VRVGQALSTLARGAVELLDAANAERIRECDADDCAMVFYDESRSNNRRWCSMARCGNRAKVRKHRATQRPTIYSTTATSFQNAT
jgi:predicted RNA-binding Zn ribbon-like protein